MSVHPDQFDDAENFYREVFYQRLLSHEPGRVLDIGCGDGDLLERLSKDGVTAKGIDPNTEKIAKLRQTRGLEVSFNIARSDIMDRTTDAS